MSRQAIPARALCSVLGVFVAALFSVFFLVNTAHASPGVSISSVVTNDANNNGTVDQVVVTFSTTVQILDGNAGNGLPSITFNDGCTIVNADYGSAGTTTLTLNLSGCTSGDTSITPTLTYTAVADCTTTGSICGMPGASPQLSSGGTLSTDGAKPVLSQVAIGGGGGSYNYIQFYYSEPIQVSNGGSFSTSSVTSSSTLAAMTTAKTVDGIATFNGSSDMADSAATNNTVTVNNAFSPPYISVTFNTAAAGYFSAGSTGPGADSYTPVSNVAAVKDLAGNAVNASSTPVTAIISSSWDVTPPTIVTTYSCDVGNLGVINRLQLNFSESVVDVAMSAGMFEGDNDAVNNGVGEETAASYSTSTQGCDGSAAVNVANDNKASIDLTTGISGTDAAFVNIPAAAGRDLAGNRFAAVDGGGTETDKAAPLLMSSSPANGATGISTLANITLNFSEPITSLTVGISPSVPLTNGTTLPASTVVLHSSKTPGVNTVTISVAPDSSAIAFGGAVSGGTHPFSFTVIPQTGNGGGGSGTPVSSVTVNSPNGGLTYHAGDIIPVQWGGTNYTSATVSYSTDNGVTYTEIASGLDVSGTINWTAPNVSTTQALIKVSGMSGSTVLASDTSDSTFTIIGTGTSQNPPPTGTPADTLPAGMGVSPYTGLPEAINSVHVGQYIRGTHYSTVYYIDTGLLRRPFYDEQTYFTYENSFNQVNTVTDATLAALTIGKPMLPKAGVVLVKIVSDPSVFAVEGDNTIGGQYLRWIPSESVATSLYGSHWADYVIDLPVTIFPQFKYRSPMTTSDVVDLSIMKTRVQVNP